MPLSAGQMAMPRRAMWSDRSFDNSAFLKRIEPSRRPTMPMIDFRVVVLPAPLRPSSVTSSPSRTSKSTPCRTWDSPYQALRPFTERRISAIAGPEIRLHDLRILRHRLVVAFGEDLAALQHGDGVAERRDHRKVVLDHQHRAVRRHALHQGGDALDVRMRH